MKSFLTPAETALRLGISPALVRRYCRQGRLGQRIGRDWIISLDDLERFKQLTRQVGRPPK